MSYLKIDKEKELFFFKNRTGSKWAKIPKFRTFGRYTQFIYFDMM